MEQQESINTEQVLANAIDVLASQADDIESIAQFATGVKQYVRAFRMMNRICQAHAIPGTEAERDLVAMSSLLSDVESWVDLQESAIRDWQVNLATGIYCFHGLIHQALANGQQSEIQQSEAGSSDTQ